LIGGLILLTIGLHMLTYKEENTYCNSPNGLENRKNNADEEKQCRDTNIAYSSGYPMVAVGSLLCISGFVIISMSFYRTTKATIQHAPPQFIKNQVPLPMFASFIATGPIDASQGFCPWCGTMNGGPFCRKCGKEL
jgi:hypothetical protein